MRRERAAETRPDRGAQREELQERQERDPQPGDEGEQEQHHHPHPQRGGRHETLPGTCRKRLADAQRQGRETRHDAEEDDDRQERNERNSHQRDGQRHHQRNQQEPAEEPDREAAHRVLEHGVRDVAHPLRPHPQREQADEVHHREERDGGEEPERPQAHQPAPLVRAGREDLADAHLHVLAHHLRAALDLHLAHDGNGLAQHQRALVDDDAPAHRYRVALDDAARLQLDGAADADDISMHHRTLSHLGITEEFDDVVLPALLRRRWLAAAAA